MILSIAGAFAFVLCSGLASAAYAKDARTPIVLPNHVRDAFLEEMRTHLDSLDEIMAAIADGSFVEAAELAETNLYFGDHMWHSMSETGVSKREIRALRRKMGMEEGAKPKVPMVQQDKLHSILKIKKKKKPVVSVGQYIPQAMHAMGGSFYGAGQHLADVLYSAKLPPTRDDYKNAMSAISDVTAACRACHVSFKVK